jgi:group I intron endonuclease
MLIYKATNKINNKVYIGQTTLTLEERKKYHKSAYKTHDYYFYRAIRKYGWDNFEWEVLDESAKTEDELDYLEEYYISLYDSFDNKEKGYNTQSGGHRFRVTEEIKKQRSERVKGDKNPMYKSKLHVGEKFTDEHKKKISDALKGKPHETTKGENNPSAKKVINITTGKIYGCIKDANIDLNLPENSDAIVRSIKRGDFAFNCKFDFYNENKIYNIGEKGIKGNKSHKMIIDESGNIYKSIAEAANSFGCSRVVVRKVCNKEKESYKGKIWKYYYF